MNKALQKWANSKLKTIKMWSKEYDELCKAEEIKENPPSRSAKLRIARCIRK